TGIPVGAFDPKRYRQFTSLNTDYRKFQDGLRITVSLDEAELAKLTAFLEGERQAGNLRYGLCVQDSAILTCYVPSVTSDSHFHFLDGAGGGYAQAAENMRS
ncbi:MAG: adenylate cyclase, partial [Rhizobiaceae bacterium]|nr:adenylate cyclase [Rhizobiaceae bacterium]